MPKPAKYRGVVLTSKAQRKAIQLVRRAQDGAGEMTHFRQRSRDAKTADTADKFEQRAFEHEEKMRHALNELLDLLGEPNA